jgi:peptidoglycan hydrolase-like protein with peptidoglycan-binding domain
MANPGQPTVKPGDTGEIVRRLQRAVRRTGDPELVVDGNFGPETESALKLFQEGEGLTVDGICGPATWDALPDGGPMPILKQGSSGAVVSALQSVLTSGAPYQWRTTPNGVDGSFGPNTEASVKAFQAWGGVLPDGIVGDQTWSASLHAAGATLETAVGLNFVVD